MPAVLLLSPTGGGGIFNSHNRGSVQGGVGGVGVAGGIDAAGDMGAHSFVGGIAGKASDGIYNSYNTGTIIGGVGGTGGIGANTTYLVGSYGGVGGSVFVGGIVGEGDVHNSFNIAYLVGGQGGNGGNGGNILSSDGGSNGGAGGDVFVGGLNGSGRIINSFSVLFSQLNALRSLGGASGLDGYGRNMSGIGASGVINLGLLVGQATAAPTNCFYAAAQTDWNPVIGTGSVDEEQKSFDDSFQLEGGTSVLDALNAWVAAPINVEKPCSYWKMKDGYPMQDHTAESFTITYSSGGRLGVDGTVDTDHKISDVPLKLSTQRFTRPHPWVQIGWSLSSDGTAKDFELGGTFTIDQNITLYPYWEDSRENGEVLSAPTLDTKTETSFRINEITSSTGQPVKYAISEPNSNFAPADNWQTGTEFTGLSAGVYYVFARTEADGEYKQGLPSPALEVKVGYCNITWNLNGGNWNENYTPEKDYKINQEEYTPLPKTLHKAGHTFQGWFSDEQLATPAPNITKSDRGDKQFYAKWKPNILSVSYSINGGIFSEKHAYGEEFVLYNGTTTPVKPDHAFLGWHVTGEGSIPNSWKPKMSVTSNQLSSRILTQDASVTLTAVWLSSQSLEVESSGNQLSVKTDLPESFTYEWELKSNDTWTICSTSAVLVFIPGETAQEYRCHLFFAGRPITVVYHTVPAAAHGSALSGSLLAILITVPLLLLAAAALSAYFFVLRSKRLALAAQGGQINRIDTTEDAVQTAKVQEVKTPKATSSKNSFKQHSQKSNRQSSDGNAPKKEKSRKQAK